MFSVGLNYTDCLSVDFFDPFGVGSASSGSDLFGDLLGSDSASSGFKAPAPASNSSLFNLSEFCSDIHINQNIGMLFSIIYDCLST